MDAILDKMFTEAGALAAILCFGNVMLWRAWAGERKARERLESEYREFILRVRAIAPNARREA